MQKPYGASLTQRRQIEMDRCQEEAWKAWQAQYRLTSWPYYSRVKFSALRVGAAGGPYTYTLAAGTEATAFSYAVGDGKVPAGFNAADGVATVADTNLTTRRQTTGGQNVLIHGIAVQPLPCSLHLNDGDAPPARVRLADAKFLAALFEVLSIRLQLNGAENSFRLGSLGQIPGAGGLTGQSRDALGPNDLAGHGKSLGFGTNGWPVRSNAFRLPEGLVWKNQGNEDANLDIVFRADRAVVLNSGGSPEAAAAGAGIDVAADNLPANVATGAVGYEFPTEVVITLLVHLIAKVKGPRSRSV